MWISLRSVWDPDWSIGPGSQWAHWAHLLGEGLFLLRLEELGCLALHFFHARLMGSIEGALVFQGLGLHFGLLCLHQSLPCCAM